MQLNFTEKLQSPAALPLTLTKSWYRRLLQKSLNKQHLIESITRIQLCPYLYISWSVLLLFGMSLSIQILHSIKDITVSHFPYQCTEISHHTFNSTWADGEQRCWFDKQVKICSIFRWGFAVRLNERCAHNVCPNWIICVEQLCGSHQSTLVSCTLPSSCSFGAELCHVSWHTHAQLGAHFQQPSVVVNEILLTFWHRSACGIETDLHSECHSVLDSLVNLALLWIVELFQVFFLSFGCASWGERYDKNI